MNFLAHTYLSGISSDLLAGNFIGDFVKGKNYKNFPGQISNGILLHRDIDLFTDTHEIVKETKSHFIPIYRKYAGIIVDILYDHYLSKNWNKFSTRSLDDYIESIHKTLASYFPIFPENVKNFFPKFVKNNWLKEYGSILGVEKVLNGMSKNTSLPDKTKYAIEIINTVYDKIEDEFLRYFPELIAFVTKKYDVKFGTIPPKMIHLTTDNIGKASA